MKKRVLVQIDGSNFYHRLKELRLKKLLDFNYKKFGEFLARKNKLVTAKYYIGAIREEKGNPKSKKLMKSQQKLLGRLQNQGWEIGFGHMLKTDSYHEKGVDVLIATDILIGAYEDLYDIVVLVSSDTDLLPAIKKASKLGKTVEYVGFSHKPSYAMIKNCTSRYLLKKEDLEEFLE